MIPNPNVRLLREELDLRGIPYEEHDYEAESCHFEATEFEHGGHSYSVLYSYAISDDSERVGVSLGWRFGYLELRVDDGEPMMCDASEIVGGLP